MWFLKLMFRVLWAWIPNSFSFVVGMLRAGLIVRDMSRRSRCSLCMRRRTMANQPHPSGRLSTKPLRYGKRKYLPSIAYVR